MATHTSQLASSSLSARNGATRDKVRPRGESASPRRASTLPPLLSEMSAVPHKRIVVCCDGTWQDGIVVDARWKYTNVLRLSRAINHVDDRVPSGHPISQVVFYQSGVGSSNNLYDQIVDGATGASLGEKVEEAYAFIAQNYHPGDEIFLFGFSRGAYTARMVASFIGKIGILDRTDMDHFADIFIAFQKIGKMDDDDDEKGKPDITKFLTRWTAEDSPGKKRASASPNGFSIKCVGVFDTVGSVGLPEELTRRSNRIRTLFGFSDNKLGDHIERAYQALALNERRADFDCAKFEQQESGRRKGQVLKQCWFTGCHSDIGGGYQEHDLADLTLTWMAAHVGDILSLNVEYIASLPDPVALWGEQASHNSAVGIFSLAKTIQRKIPTAPDEITHETIHPSVLEQKLLSEIIPELLENVKKNPGLVAPLLPLEEELKRNWKVIQNKENAQGLQKQGSQVADNGKTSGPSAVTQSAISATATQKSVTTSADGSVSETQSSASVVAHQTTVASTKWSWVANVSAETSVAALVKELI